MKKRVNLLNISLSLLLQIVSAISGLISQRLILYAFGANVNGLVSSISEFLNYITLIEGGIRDVISANLYKPLVEKDWDKTSSILATSNAFYRKIGLVFICYTVMVGVVYPNIVETGFDFLYVFVLTCVLSIGLLLQYMFSVTMTILLSTDMKIYIVSFLSIISTIGNIGLVVLVVKFFPDIILLKAASAALLALQPLVFGYYIKRHYNIDWRAPKDNSLIKQRWNGFAINFAFFIHTSIDVTILTLMNDLKMVSVYIVYYFAVDKISVLIHSITWGIEPTIGQTYARNDIDDLHEKMNLYEFIIFCSIGILFTLMALLITPFVSIYTDGITDTNYYQPIFGMVLVLAEALYLLSLPHFTLANVANKFKKMTVPAYMEAVINIAVSVALIRPFGLVGIAIGTASGALCRMIFHVSLTEKIIPNRRQSIFYRKLLIFMIVTVAGMLICRIAIPFETVTITEWIVHAIVYGIIIVILYFSTSMIFFKREIRHLVNYIRRR